MEIFSKWAAESLTNVFKSTPEWADLTVTALELETPKESTQGDVAFPCFKLSKALKKSPQALALEIAEKLTKENLKGLSVTASGPYVNFTAHSETLFKEILPGILTDKCTLIELPKNSREKWVIEFSSPNVAKPFMIYHFRPTGLGASLYRIGKKRGYEMISINHLGDWGTQFGKLYVAFQRYGKMLPESPGILDLVQIYVKLHEDIEKEPKIEDEAREAFRRLEKKDPEVTANWKMCIEISMKEFNTLYKKLNVQFDHIWGESFYEAELPPLLEKLRSTGITELSEGAWIANVLDAKGKELPPCLLQRSDGGTLYATRDVAAALYRNRVLNFDRMTYIVGGEQRLHFEQVFGVLRKMGETFVSKCEHVPTGLYHFKDSKMSTRKGNFVTLNEVFDLAKERVSILMKERGANEGLSDEAFLEITEKVALGAIVFNDFHSDPGKDVEFDVERVVDFEGETGPYLQYAHTRCLSILRKSENTVLSTTTPEQLLSLLKHPAEIALVRQFGLFPKVLEQCLNTRKLSSLTHYLVDISKSFGLFYRECQVNGVEMELSKARLTLVDCTRKVLNEGLTLLGIPLPDKM